MVARGDLGVEIPMETLANVQKDLVRRSNLAGKTDIISVFNNIERTLIYSKLHLSIHSCVLCYTLFVLINLSSF